MAIAIVAMVSAGAGLVLENASALGTWMDIVSIYIIPLGALLAGFIFFWVCGKEFTLTKVQTGRAKKIGPWFLPMGRYIFCGATIVVYILGIIYGGIG